MGETDQAVFFNIGLVIPSTPAAELLRSLQIRECISSVEQVNQARVEETLYSGMGVLETSSRLKHSEKN